jgi:hypothetical protein
MDHMDQVKKRITGILKVRPVPQVIFDDDGNITSFISSKHRLVHDGITLNAAVVPNFCQDVLGIDPSALWEVFTTMELHDVDAELTLDDGWNTKLLPGAHPALNYRGKPVARTKFWLQSDFDKGMKKYGYTGWQWRTALAQRRIESVPVIDEVNKTMNRLLPERLHNNHAIGTMYVDGDDYIGQHSDKVKDFAKHSGFIVIKLGAARRFQFGTKEGKIFYDERLTPGTAVIVGHDANVNTVHSVPKDSLCTSPSGSIVFRCIDTVIPWSTVHSKIRTAKYN